MGQFGVGHIGLRDSLMAANQPRVKRFVGVVSMQMQLPDVDGGESDKDQWADDVMVGVDAAVYGEFGGGGGVQRRYTFVGGGADPETSIQSSPVVDLTPAIGAGLIPMRMDATSRMVVDPSQDDDAPRCHRRASVQLFVSPTSPIRGEDFSTDQTVGTLSVADDNGVWLLFFDRANLSSF